jgi:hypothetical protein
MYDCLYVNTKSFQSYKIKEFKPRIKSKQIDYYYSLTHCPFINHPECGWDYKKTHCIFHNHCCYGPISCYHEHIYHPIKQFFKFKETNDKEIYKIKTRDKKVVMFIYDKNTCLWSLCPQFIPNKKITLYIFDTIENQADELRNVIIHFELQHFYMMLFLLYKNNWLIKDICQYFIQCYKQTMNYKPIIYNIIKY